MIEIFCEEVDNPVENTESVFTWINAVVEKENKLLGDLTIIFCNDDYLLEVNKKYLNHNYLTDIITFDYTSSNIISGDLFISVNRIEENAKLFSVKFENELLRVIIHGILHLLGYNDKTEHEKNFMRELENKYLKRY